jgi:glycosyltransferase involved in cell wall biosynthesis
MKVAVVTPSIGSDTLRKCIESVDNQTYENLEIILRNLLKCVF